MAAITAGRNKRSRPVGYAPWSPRAATRETLDQILSVLDDHRDYWPITPRQVLYRLMGRGQATKSDAERIGDYLVRGRRAGFIPWEAIGDGRTESAVPIVCDDPEAFFAEMRESASVYRLDRQEGQPVYIEMVVEAAGAVDQVFRTTVDYGVPVRSGSGFVTVTRCARSCSAPSRARCRPSSSSPATSTRRGSTSGRASPTSSTRSRSATRSRASRS